MQLGDRAETQRHGDVLQVFFQRYSSKKHAKERTRAAKADKRKSKHNGSGAESGGEGNHASVDDDTDPVTRRRARSGRLVLQSCLGDPTND